MMNKQAIVSLESELDILKKGYDNCYIIGAFLYYKINLSIFMEY